MNKSEFYKDARTDGRGPLAGIRVLEATNYGAGPICGMVLSDLGAESIKCGQPQGGDPIRAWPPYVCGADGKDLWSGVWGLTFNRGKRGVTLDLRQPQGQDLFRRLAAQAEKEHRERSECDAPRVGVGPDVLSESARERRA